MAFQSLRSIGLGIVVKYEARNPWPRLGLYGHSNKSAVHEIFQRRKLESTMSRQGGPKLETISNDKNSNDQNIIIERLIIGECWVGLCFGFWTFEF
ncbi:MAG: hypothetical protein DRG66_04750 [Deltaproteobacteria bacterium]|jgi:hypothetical protein|nr:MAG: hypothetical protein DRG66_04750 [Deltaproteobacteria bacterium]